MIPPRGRREDGGGGKEEEGACWTSFPSPSSQWQVVRYIAKPENRAKLEIYMESDQPFEDYVRAQKKDPNAIGAVGAAFFLLCPPAADHGGPRETPVTIRTETTTL